MGFHPPLIVHWPDGLKVQAGSITRQPAHLIDFMATFIELAETTYPQKVDNRTISSLEGKSLTPIFNGKKEMSMIHYTFTSVQTEHSGKENGNLYRQKEANGSFII